MRAISGISCKLTRHLAILGILGTATLSGLAAGQERPVRPGQPETPPPSKATAAAPAQAEPKTFAFEMRNKPWPKVFEWLSDKSGLNVFTSNMPQGSFTFIAPENKRYTIPEIVDLINEGLIREEHILIRRTQSFMLIPSDKKIDPSILPRIKLDELDKHGNTEIVSVVYPVKTVNVEELATEVKKLLSNFGEVSPITLGNRLVLQDTVGNLHRIIKTLEDIEKSETGQADAFTYKCKYIKARDAAATLREVLGNPADIIRLNQPQGFVQPGGGFLQPGMDPRMIRGPTPAAPAAPTPRVKPYHISSDDRSNTVLVSGPADKIAQARTYLKEMDIGQPGQEIWDGPPSMQIYPAPGNAEALAKTLGEIYKSPQSIRISNAGPNAIVVWACPEDQKEIAKQIKSNEKGYQTEKIPLTTQEASTVAGRLGKMLPEQKAGGPFIDSDSEQNVLIVRGTAEQVAEIKEILKVIGDNDTGDTRTILLDKGSAPYVASELQRLLSGVRKNPVKVVVPGQEAPAAESKDNNKKSSSSSCGEEAEEPPANQTGSQLVDPQEKKNAGKDDKQESPITIIAVGDRLIVKSDDPKALQMVAELTRLITKTQGEGRFQVIPLRNAVATDVAKVLDEIYNGPKQNTQQNPFSRVFFPGGPAPQQTTPTNTEPKVRVVADPATNSLLVKAPPAEMYNIRQLLDTALDTGKTNSNAIIKTWIIPLKHANANEVAEVVRNVYREYMNNNPLPGQGFSSGRSFFSSRFGGSTNQNLDAQGNPRAVSLSVGVDDRSNSLVVACNSLMKTDIETLAGRLDEAASNATRTVKVISVKGVDPLLVQQAVDAIQGRRTSITPGGGPSSFVPTGTGGLIPGMGSRGSYPGSGYPGSYQGGYPGSYQGGSFPGAAPPGSGSGPPFRRSSSSGQQSRGPDFFAHRVKDDPESSLLYDPQAEAGSCGEAAPAGDGATPASAASTPIQLTRHEQQAAPQPQPQPPAQQPSSGDIRSPRSSVNAEALEQLGVIVISGNSPQDVAEIEKIINYIIQLGAGAEVRIQVVPLEHADATSVANTLSQLFQRVNVGATFTAPVTGRPPTTGAPVTGPFVGTQQPAAQQAAAAQGAGSVFLLPLPRFNAILLAAPRARFDEMVLEIKRLDRPNAVPAGGATAFPLKKAPAARVATLLNNFYASRYPNDVNQVRAFNEDSTNTVFVQAAPADLAEIRELINRLDNTVSSAVNELRIVPLRNVLSDELAAILQQAISQGVAPVTTTALPTAPRLPTTPTPAAPTPFVPTPTGPTPTPTAPGATGAPSKTTTLRILRMTRTGPQVVESGLLEDIHITSDPRINSLVISAPPKAMDLVMALIQQLDVLPALRADISFFQLKKADATNTAQLLQTLYTGATTPGAPAPTPTVPGAPTAPRPVTPTTPTGAPTAPTGAPTGAVGVSPEGTPLIELHIAVDLRTNSIVVSGSRADLDNIEGIISRLDDAEVKPRRNEVYYLRNAAAADVANALTTFIGNSLAVLTKGAVLTNFQEYERDVVVVPEPVTNKLLISATPEYYAEVMRLIQELDAEPAQVVIQVLLAEVDLNGTEEFGVEIGLQSPVLFNRGIFPASAFAATSTTSFSPLATATTPGTQFDTVGPGVTVSSSAPPNPAGFPGYLFNNVFNGTIPLGQNVAVNPAVVGYQGLGNLGVGRISPTSGIGGFVFSAASDSFNLLIRALKTQGRMDVLSRPQLMTLDNQQATILVGQYFPYLSATNVTTGVVTSTVSYANLGVQLTVTPRISPDGKVLMRVTPSVSSAAATIALGGGINGTPFNVQTVDTTVLAGDGETVAIGGLIMKTDNKAENKIPWFGDLPGVGALFRYRTQSKSKRELLVIMTPHIVRSKYDADVILSQEAKRMDWVLGDVVKVHGTTGLEPILPAPKDGAGAPGGPALDGVLPPVLSPSAPGAPVLVPAAPSHEELMPSPRNLTPAAAPAQPPATPNSGRAPAAPALPPPSVPAAAATPAHEESSPWRPSAKPPGG
jgi:type II secretory pathway component GspD/PulD (secretin)